MAKKTYEELEAECKRWKAETKNMRQLEKQINDEWNKKLLLALENVLEVMRDEKMDYLEAYEYAVVTLREYYER